MSEEKTQVQNARKDLDILNKMKNLPGGLVHLYHRYSRSEDM